MRGRPGRLQDLAYLAWIQVAVSACVKLTAEWDCSRSVSAHARVVPHFETKQVMKRLETFSDELAATALRRKEIV